MEGKMKILCSLGVLFLSRALAAPIMRINSGSVGATTDSDGNIWSADNYFTTGYFDYATRCAGTPYGPHCKIRSFNVNRQNAPFGYAVPLPNADYQVVLHFVETHWSNPGNRIMDVVVEGVTVFPSLDIVAESGAKNAPFSFTVDTTVTDGILDIEVVSVQLNPLIAGFEIFSAGGIIAPDIRVNCGGPAYTDSEANVWAADTYFNSGATFVASGEIADTVDDALFHSERYFNGNPPYQYLIPVAVSGEYTVTMHFTENWFQNVGGRVFGVWVEGQLVKDSLDIYAEAGHKKAYTLEIVVSVSDGFLTVELSKIIENPKISAIKVVYNAGPTEAPTTAAPSASPQPSAAPSVTPEFQTILINCGGGDYTDVSGTQTWVADYGFEGGAVATYPASEYEIANTADDALYRSERFGEFTYEIPVPVGNYEVVIHLAELFWQSTNSRVFNMDIEGTVFGDVDIVSLGGPLAAFTIETVVIVSDGYLSIAMTESVNIIDLPKISAIEIKLNGAHLAHAVANGPYYGVVTDPSSDSAIVSVDGSPSHTHGTGMELNSWLWREGAVQKGTGEATSFSMEVGVHDLILTVMDDGGNESSNPTTVTVFPFGYPVVSTLSQTTGSTTGGDQLTITGIGFTFTSTQTTVHFGLQTLSGNDLQIVDENTISILVPPALVAAPVSVSVETPLGESIATSYTYESMVPIDFDSNLLVGVTQPTVARFAKDGTLFVGTNNGKIYKYTLNADHTAVVATVFATVEASRAILGIAFDPLDDDENPRPYVSTNLFFHEETLSSSGLAINGDVRRLSGANLDTQETIISGLPVSDHDHGVNGLEFGDNGELYIQVGGNTNGGIPGQLTSLQIQKEGYFSAATVVAHLGDPLFDGVITYDSPDDGSVVGGHGIEIFAAGTRNPFGIVLHSNGLLYGTDNGPNAGYGDMQTGCGEGEFSPDVYESDKLNLLIKDKYYGHPNTRRAIDDNDQRQCAFRSKYEESDENYEAPLLSMTSSQGGIMEWQTNHFFGQLRDNLITSQYTQGMHRIILDPSGTAVIPESIPAIPFIGSGGLDVTQSPSGTLIEVRLSDNNLYAHKPTEPPTTALYVNGVFPRRGSEAGGGTLKIYGKNFENGMSVNVIVGGDPCPTVSISSVLIECTLPGGVGTVDINVVAGTETSSFQRGYRYITGLPETALSPKTPSPTIAPTTIPPTTSVPTASPSISMFPSISPAPTTRFPIDGEWILVDSDAPILARHESCFVMVNQKGYLIGGRGNKRVDIYDPTTRTWSVGAQPDIQIHHMQCVAVEDKIYIVAGWTGNYPTETNLENVYVYNTLTDAWEKKTALPSARRRGSAAVIVNGRRIYVSHGTVGGHEEYGQDLVTCVGWLDYYDVDADTWTTGLPDAPHPRGHTGGALVNGKICVSGGRDGGTPGWPSVAETDCFDLANGTWSTEESIPQPRAGASYGTSCDGQLMIAGGEGDGGAGNIAWSAVDLFDGTSWSSLPELNIARHGSGLAVDCACRQIHIAAGSGGPGGGPELTSVETYFFDGTDTECALETILDETLSPSTDAPTAVSATNAPTNAPVSTAPFSFSPISSAPTSAAPTLLSSTDAPVSAAPTSSAPVSVEPTSSSPIATLPTSTAPTVDAATFSPISTAPASSFPVSTAPVSSAPSTVAPVSTSPISTTPVSMAPITSAPSRTPLSSAPTVAPSSAGGPLVLLLSDFSQSSDGFMFKEDTFRGTDEPQYASGTYDPTGGLLGDGSLEIVVGGVDNSHVSNMSGGWEKNFTVPQNMDVSIILTYQLEHSDEFESNEYGEVLVSIDGMLVPLSGNDYVAQIYGDKTVSTNQVIGYETVTLLGVGLPVGSHRLTVGGYNNKKTYNNEETWVRIDSVEVIGI